MRYFILSLIFFLAIIIIDYTHANRHSIWRIELNKIRNALDLYAKNNDYFYPIVDDIFTLKEFNHLDRRKIEKEIGRINYLPGSKYDNQDCDHSYKIIFWANNGEKIFFIENRYKDDNFFNYEDGALPFIGYSVEKERVRLHSDLENLKMDDSKYNDILLRAIMLKDSIVMDFLIKKNLYLNYIDPNGITPLMRAVSNRDTKTVEALLNKNVDISQKNIFGDDALAIARKTKNSKIIDMLEKHKILIHKD